MKTDKVFKMIFYWLKIIILAGSVVFIIRGFLLIPMAVTGNSMENSLYENDQVVYEKITTIKRFDTVIFEKSDGTTYIKRVIGLPGERISYIGNQLFIDGKKTKETFWDNQPKMDESLRYTNSFDTIDPLPTGRVAKDSYFVLGDNRLISNDSRSFGVVTADKIIGKARFIYFPLKHFGTIK